MRKNLRIFATVAAFILIGIVVYFGYEALRKPTVNEKLAQIIHLEDQRLPAGRLTPYFTDESDEIRQRAALAVGRIGGVGSASLLFKLLGDQSLDVAGMAAFAIGLTGETDYAATLADRSDRLPSSVAAQAIISVGRLADSTMPDLSKSLLRFLLEPSPEIREATCYALYYAGAKKLSEVLIPFVLSEKDADVKRAALFTLSRFGLEIAVGVYPRFQADSDPSVRILAVRGLGAGKGDGTVQLIAMSLNDKDNRVVSQAIASLQKVGGDESIRYLSSFLNNAQDEKLIVQTINALRALESDSGEEMVLIHLRSDLSENMAVAAIKYLATIKGEKSVLLIDSLLTIEPTPRIKAACIEALGIIGHKSVLPRLSTLFSDEDPLVRGTAFEELVKLDSSNINYYIDKALADLDPMPIVLALNQIESRNLTDYTPKLNELMIGSVDIDVDIRRSIVSVASTFITKSNSDSIKIDSAYVHLLALGIMDDNYIVRQAAAEAYSDLLGKDEQLKVFPAKTRISQAELIIALEKYKRNPTAIITTSKGEIELELYFDIAPLTVLNFIELAGDGFYDGLIFHRVIPNFVAQGGDPRGDGWGGSSYFIRCEYSREPYITGTLGIATSGRDTGGSQFFITYSPQPHLEARYTVFGQVTGGMDIADLLVVGDLIEQIQIR